MACITEGSIGYPGSNAHIPPTCGTLAEVMRQAGWSTFWLGKNHNVPVDDLHAGARRRPGRSTRAGTASTASSAARRTSGIPTSTDDNHPIEQPYTPEEGYHLSKDLADKAIR